MRTSEIRHNGPRRCFNTFMTLWGALLTRYLRSVPESNNNNNAGSLVKQRLKLFKSVKQPLNLRENDERMSDRVRIQPDNLLFH